MSADAAYVLTDRLQVAVFTDPNVAKLPPAKMVCSIAQTEHDADWMNDFMALLQAIASLEAQQDLPFEVYDRVVTEPTEASWRDAIAWAREHDCSHFLA